MIEVIRRITFGRDKVTIYSDAGTLAIWRGKPYHALAALISEGIAAINRKMEEERHANQEQGSTEVDAREQAGDGEAVGSGDAEGQETAGEGETEEVTLTPI